MLETRSCLDGRIAEPLPNTRTTKKRLPSRKTNRMKWNRFQNWRFEGKLRNLRVYGNTVRLLSQRRPRMRPTTGGPPSLHLPKEYATSRPTIANAKDAIKPPAGIIRGVRKQEMNHVDTLPVAPPATYEHCPLSPHDSLCTLSDVVATRKKSCLGPPIASKTRF